MDYSILPLFALQPETREIPLTQGQVAIVDAADFEWLSQWNWHAHKGGNTFYARRHSPTVSGKSSKILMHQVIAGKGADHIDGDGLNNTRENLRLATKQENACNQRKPKNNTSGYKGVTWHKHRKKWEAQIKFNSKNKHLGYFSDLIEAALAYNVAARELFGEYAKLNEAEL